MSLDTLSYAIRPRVVLAYLGELCLALAIVTAVPLVVSLWCGEHAMGLRFGGAVAGLATGGFLLSRLPRATRLQENEGMVLVALTFLIAPLVTVYPIMAAGLCFEDALFEAISGVTTTGLTTVAEPADMPRAFLFARAWMQWYGGLGIVVLSIAFVVHAGLAAKGLAVTESAADDLAGGTKAHARHVTLVYVLLTGACIAVLWLLGLDPFDAVVYALAAVSTGGFAPHGDSLAALGNWWAQAAVTLFCLAGAGAFTLYYTLFQDRQRIGLETAQLRALVILAAIGTALTTLALWRVEGLGPLAGLRDAPLLALSAQTTAGFSTVAVAGLHEPTKLALIPAMAIGGSVGSTAGGFKILRLLVLLRLAQATVTRARSARHAVIEVRVAGDRLEESEVNGALLVILLYGAVILLSWSTFIAGGYAPLDSLFEVVSAIGTVGLSAGVTSAGLPVALKSVLCIDMLLGRLEIVCWLVALHPRTWIGRRQEEL